MSESVCKRILKLDKFVAVFGSTHDYSYTRDYCYATLMCCISHGKTAHISSGNRLPKLNNVNMKSKADKMSH